MNIIQVRNVLQALPEGCHQMMRVGVVRESRNGKVLMMPGVTVTEYAQPWERVLLDFDRDANPFFHFMEALWMLAGHRDVAWPKKFNSKFDAYSDDSIIFNGAYGWRWRNNFNMDQLITILDALKKNPDCRRQVLAMWDGHSDLGSSSKDIPCNLLATFQIGARGELNMVVNNRSNDLIWGAYGANAVHFSMLLEYMAANLHREIGTYTQVSSNTHIYEPHWLLMNKLAGKAPMPPSKREDVYSLGMVSAHPMISIDRGLWDLELKLFLELQERGNYMEPFFARTAVPMFNSYMAFSDRNNPNRFANALHEASEMLATDWRVACVQWLKRREEKANS